MSKMKELLYNILEDLASTRDYQLVADRYGLTIPQVVQIAKDYGDFDDSMDF